MMITDPVIFLVFQRYDVSSILRNRLFDDLPQLFLSLLVCIVFPEQVRLVSEAFHVVFCLLSSLLGDILFDYALLDLEVEHALESVELVARESCLFL
jgi:hypothetical protein